MTDISVTDSDGNTYTQIVNRKRVSVFRAEGLENVIEVYVQRRSRLGNWVWTVLGLAALAAVMLVLELGCLTR